MIWFILISVLIPVLDCLFKFYVIHNLSSGEEIATFIPFLSIVKVKNFGIAFGIFKGQTELLILLISVILAMILSFVFSKKVKSKQLLLAFSFVVGGGIGNLIDRIFLGYVVDYLKLSFFPPVCNLSDYFICLGALIIAFYCLRKQN